MKRREFITLLGSAAAAWPIAAGAQQAAIAVMGYVGTGSRESDAGYSGSRASIGREGRNAPRPLRSSMS